MKTGFYCNYDLKDITAIEDSTPTTAHNQDFANILGLKEGTAFEDYATLEEDYFLLDGKMQEFPDEPQGIVFFSSELSADRRELCQ